MSASVEEISHVGTISDHHGCEGGDGDDDEDEDEDEDDDIGSGARARNDAKKRASHGFGKAKRVVLRQFTKAKKQLRLHGRRSKKASRSSSSAVNASRTSGETIFEDSGGVGKGCYFCLTCPRVLESSPPGSEINDPNDPKFTYEMLKTLIEKNDFYSKECNTHIN